MSFESYLSYDQPRKKKKKIVKTSTTALGEKGLKKNDSKSTSKNSDSVQKLPKVNENKLEKLLPAGADSAKPKKVTPVAPSLSEHLGLWSSQDPPHRHFAWLASPWWPVEFQFEVISSSLSSARVCRTQAQYFLKCLIVLGPSHVSPDSSGCQAWLPPFSRLGLPGQLSAL